MRKVCGLREFAALFIPSSVGVGMVSAGCRVLPHGSVYVSDFLEQNNSFLSVVAGVSKKEMPKHDFMSPKAISNRIKSKGLQKLRWFCQMCEKQCRDEVR